MQNSNDKKVFTKQEIAEIQYYYLQYLFEVNTPPLTKKKLELVKEFNSSENGKLFFSTNLLLNKTKLISLMKDDAFNFIDNRKLDSEIGNSLNGIFLDKEDAEYFDNKGIINNLRIAFAHGLFEITNDSKYIIIKMMKAKDKNKNPHIFNVVLSHNHLDIIYKAIYDTYSNAPILQITLPAEATFSNETLKEDINKIMIKRVFPNNTNSLDLNTLKQMKNAFRDEWLNELGQNFFIEYMKTQKVFRQLSILNPSNGYEEALENLNVLYQEFEKYNYLIKDFETLNQQFINYIIYELNDNQKEILFDMLSKTAIEDRKPNLKSYIKKLLPIAITKIEDFEKTSKKNISENDDLGEELVTNIITFCDYVLKNFGDLESNKEINCYRNALTHGRYYLNYNHVTKQSLLDIEIHLYDGKRMKGIKKENNFPVEKTVKLWELYKLSCDILVDTLEKNQANYYINYDKRTK